MAVRAAVCGSAAVRQCGSAAMSGSAAFCGSAAVPQCGSVW